MSYIINKTDGSVLTEVVDGTIDQSATCLTLIGKNASSYGEFLNENFVHLLENFASETSPTPPRTGQTWYDISEGRLKVYDGTAFKVSGGTVVSGIVPETIAGGDLWIDSDNQQLHFNDGTNTVLAGPIYTSQQGISGFSVEDLFDSDGIKRTIVKVYVAQILIGILSKFAFTPGSAIPGFTGDIGVGFTAGSQTGIKFDVTTTKAETLISYHPITGELELKTASSFLSTVNDSTTVGSLTIQNSTPLILGPNQNNEINVSTGLLQINSNISDQNFEINCLNGSGLKPSIHINAQSEYIGLYTDVPTQTLDVNGGVRIRGDLLVEGDVTSINQTEINIEDIVINLGKTSSPDNTTADGGGILLEGGLDGDKTFLWENGVGSTGAWSSSEHFNLFVNKGYYINGVEVLNETALGSTVSSALGLHTIGTLSALQVDNLNLNANTISATNTNGDIILQPGTTGTVDISSKRITSLSDPVSDNDAVNKVSMDTAIRLKPLGFPLDVTGMSDADIQNIIEEMYPVSELEENTKCRIYPINLGVGQSHLKFQIINGAWISVLEFVS